MRTSILALALASVAPVAAHAQDPAWLTDYAKAYRQAAAEQRPMALVFGKGADGWRQLVGGGSLASEARQTLSKNYVPCYVDTLTPIGQAVAERFGMDGSVGIVLSDRTGGLQAFRHEGTLSADALEAYLTRYADPNRVVATTDTNPPVTPNSYYPPVAPASYYPPPQAVAPGSFTPVFGGGFGGRGCST
jgi:hypothetical protein